MPSQNDDVLPTRFGNAIKAFEVYPRDIYSADGVALWLRLFSVMPKTFGEQIQEIQSNIDFWVNCCFFSAVIGILGFGRTVWSGNWQNLDIQTFEGIRTFVTSVEYFWLIWAAGGAVVSYLFYRCAVAIVPAWGNLIMSAFDCYLPALAVQLGFEPPTSEASRRNFWTTFSQQLIYRIEPDGRMPFEMEKWKQVRSANGDKEVISEAENVQGDEGTRDGVEPDESKGTDEGC